MFTRRSTLGCLVTVLVIAAVLAGCGNKQTGEALAEPSQSLKLLPSVQPTFQPKVKLTVQPKGKLTVQPTPTRFVLGPLFNPGFDLRAGPIPVPIELQIPSLKVDAPVVGVGLTVGKEMYAPKGPIGDEIWHTAFWYRGSGIPGEPGTATFAGHVNDPLGRPEIFAHLQKLHPGDLIIVHANDANIDIRFKVDQVKSYTIQEASDPAVREQVFGAGSLDGLSHLSLVTCAGNIVNGQYDHYVVVYATRSE